MSHTKDYFAPPSENTRRSSIPQPAKIVLANPSAVPINDWTSTAQRVYIEQDTERRRPMTQYASIRPELSTNFYATTSASSHPSRANTSRTLPAPNPRIDVHIAKIDMGVPIVSKHIEQDAVWEKEFTPSYHAPVHDATNACLTRPQVEPTQITLTRDDYRPKSGLPSSLLGHLLLPMLQLTPTAARSLSYAPPGGSTQSCVKLTNTYQLPEPALTQSQFRQWDVPYKLADGRYHYRAATWTNGERRTDDFTASTRRDYPRPPDTPANIVHGHPPSRVFQGEEAVCFDSLATAQREYLTTDPLKHTLKVNKDKLADLKGSHISV